MPLTQEVSLNIGSAEQEMFSQACLDCLGMLQQSGKIEGRLKKRLEKILEKGGTPRSKTSRRGQTV